MTHRTTIIALLFLFFLQVPAKSEVAFTNKVKMEFVKIPAGSFMMGSPETEEGRSWDESRHRVTITSPFYISTTEVTQLQWFDVMGTNPSAFRDCGGDCPVENVSWYDCRKFIDKLNAMEHTKKYRLPTEAEWEYACRAGSTTAFFAGNIATTTCKPLDPILDSVGWYCGNTGYQNPVYDLRPFPAGQKKPNAFGLYDTHGNVMEWCLDACNWRDPLSGKIGVITDTYKEGIRDPLSRYGNRRVLRGGSWGQSPEHARSANRIFFNPKAKRNYIGFRVVRML